MEMICRIPLCGSHSGNWHIETFALIFFAFVQIHSRTAQVVAQVLIVSLRKERGW